MCFYVNYNAVERGATCRIEPQLLLVSCVGNISSIHANTAASCNQHYPETSQWRYLKMDPVPASQVPQEQTPMFNFSYVRDTWVGRLKITEIICSFLAGVLVPMTVYKHAAAFGFMTFVTWTTFLCAFVDLVLHIVFNIWEKLTVVVEHPEILLFLCSLGAVGLGIASVTELAVATYAENPNLPSASAVFGFLCMIALVFECYFHYQNHKLKSAERRQRQEATNYQPYQPDTTFTNINNV